MDYATFPCFCFCSRRTANVVTTYYDAAIKSTGITTPQLALLTGIRKLEAPSISQLAQEVRLQKSTLTRNLRPLIAAGYVIVGAGKNRRDVALLLTPEGDAVIERAKPLWLQAQRDMVAALGGEDAARQFLGFIERIQNLNQEEAT